jgi:hypothetical protein
MKKYFLTSVLSLFLIVGTGVVLTATEKKEGCCSSKTAEAAKSASECSGTATAVQTAAKECGDKETTTQSADVQMIQTSTVEKAGCTGTAVKAECSGSSATTTTAVQTKAGECTKAPAGVSGQRASREL